MADSDHPELLPEPDWAEVQAAVAARKAEREKLVVEDSE